MPPDPRAALSAHMARVESGSHYLCRACGELHETGHEPHPRPPRRRPERRPGPSLTMCLALLEARRRIKAKGEQAP
jgi:hypothetical protein